MLQTELNRQVARRTGEDVHTIRQLGFSIADPEEVDFDPEPDDLPPQIIDWDELDQQRHVPLFEHVYGPLQPAV